VLDNFETIRIATSYRLGGRELHAPPANLNDLAACEPVYEEWPGWMTSTAGATTMDELPGAARNYLHRLEELLDTPLTLVSVGPGRGQTIHLRDLTV